MNTNRSYLIMTTAFLMALTAVQAIGTDSALHQAVGDDDIVTVTSLLADGADINAKDDKGRPPLLYAVWSASDEMIDLLLTHGADVNTRDRFGDTVFHEALTCLRQEVLDLFLTHGANLQAHDSDGQSALHLAVYVGYLPAVQSLVAAGAEIDALNNTGQTPILKAMLRDKPKIVTYLADSGAETTLHLAAYLGWREKAEQLIADGVDINAVNKMGTALHVAIRKGHLDIVQLLIGRGADVDAEDPVWNGTPLHAAIGLGNREVITWLLSAGADINHTASGKTPWERAVSTGDREIVDLFLDAGAVLTIHQAASLGDTECIQSLVDRGVDVDTVDRDNRTALYWASAERHIDTVNLLLNLGADPDIHSAWGTTPLDLAVRNGDLDIVETLIAKSDSASWKQEQKNDQLLTAAEYGYLDIARYLLLHGADVNTRGPSFEEDGFTPLHSAAYGGYADLIPLLINYGADIEARSLGKTALYWAAELGFSETVCVLATHNADVNAVPKDIWGESNHRTALFEAALKGNTDVVECLLAHGADQDVKDKHGDTALDVALRYGFTDIVTLLGGDLNHPSFGLLAPYTVIVTEVSSVRRFLRWGPVVRPGGIEFDEAWIPDESTVAEINKNLRTVFEEGRENRGGLSKHQCDYILSILRCYNREYSGFERDGQRYIICNLVVGTYTGLEEKLPLGFDYGDMDGGCNYVRIVFHADSGDASYIECNGSA